MKRSILITSLVSLLAILTLASCGKNSKAYKELAQKYDSIEYVHQTQVNELDSIVSLILTNFQDINQMEGMIDMNNLRGDVAENKRAKIEDNMRMIKERLETNRTEIAKLQDRLKASGVSNTKLQRTINALQNQLNSKDNEITKLTEELKLKNIQISQLDSTVTDLSYKNEEQNKQITSQSETIASQDKEINTVRYCVGSSRDLKDMKILVNGKVATENYQSDYFRQVDRRNFTSLDLFAKRAKLLTSHPESSYRFDKGQDKMLTLVITNTDLFWSHSKVLVVQVD